MSVLIAASLSFRVAFVLLRFDDDGESEIAHRVTDFDGLFQIIAY